MELSNTSSFPEVAVVILNWNGKTYLERFLPFALSSTYPNKRIIVADNASTDGSVELVREKFPLVEIIINEENEGFAKGYNSALKQIDSPYYVLLNSDVEVTPGWIENIVALMENDGAIAACQPKILSYNQKSKFEYAGACGGWIDKFGYPFARGRVFDTCEKDEGQYDIATRCFWASGAALFLRSSAFREVDGFDEFFFAHQEEIDLCWRLQHKGYSIYCEPASTVYHVGGGTLPVGNKRKVFLNFRNNLIMMRKNLPPGEAGRKILARLFLDGIAGIRYLLSGEVSSMFAVVKAHLAYYSWKKAWKKQRQAAVAKAPLSGKFKGSIVWKYYIGGKKTFRQIVGQN